MDGLLLKIDAQNKSNDEPLLTAVTTRSVTKPITSVGIVGAGEPSAQQPPVISESVSPTSPNTISKAAISELPEQSVITDSSGPSKILNALRTNPPIETVLLCLSQLRTTLQTPSSINSQLTKVLLETTLPDCWAVLDKKQKSLFAKCLASPTGLGGIAARIKTLIPAAKPETTEAAVERERLLDVLSLLQLVLGRRSFLHDIWSLVEKEPEARRRLLWKEFCALVGGGRLLGVTAEAGAVIGRVQTEERGLWCGDGKHFASWLGRGLAEAVMAIGKIQGQEEVEEEWRAYTGMLVAGLRLGYSETLIEALNRRLLTLADESMRLQKIGLLLQAHDKRTYLTSFLRVLSTSYLSTTYDEADENWYRDDAPIVAAAAAVLGKVISDDDDFKDVLQEWIASSSGGGVGESLSLRRAVMAVVKEDGLLFRQVTEKLLAQFADKMWIARTMIVRQEVTVQFLLLAAGIAHRQCPSFLSSLTRSSVYLNGISNRLAASSHRARWLGMLVGECFSSLVDTGKMRMDFGTEDMDTPEAKWWKSITAVEDKIGSISDLFTSSAPKRPKAKNPTTTDTVSQYTNPVVQVISQSEDEDSSDDEFTPYAAPDSDPSDGEEDAETINRNKPTAPIYLRDLLRFLRTHDSYDHQHLALQHASTLIRRTPLKTLTPHLPELASALAGLDDRFSMPNFSSLRVAALQALVVTSPIPAGRWCAHAFYTADFGLSQRAALLSAIGLAARELAGRDLPPPMPDKKKLPKKVAAAWAISSLAASIQQSTLRPIAASAADKATGPAALKIGASRTFSSRMEAEKRAPKPVHRAIVDVAAAGLFFPLTGGFVVASRDGGRNAFAETALLGLLLETLAVVLEAAGEAVKERQDMVTELVTMVMALRGRVDVRRQALLALLMAVRIAGEGVIEWEGLGEVIKWAEEGLEGEEEERVLAAGVLVGIQEQAEGWRGRMGLGGVEW
ncbi:telomere length regulation protein-domain-containing protein [Pyronema omphalodes]|nr:telomere length regulation protein-domain-containing protein [Pyronema omphalodes]